ncbi:hypothetical protein DVQ79_17775 [Yersinia enterocolitica]|nr:hypothetical protein [Yersinia enterocolitica]
MKCPLFAVNSPMDATHWLNPSTGKKHQTTLFDKIECQIIRMFALGMSAKISAILQATSRSAKNKFANALQLRLSKVFLKRSYRY